MNHNFVTPNATQIICDTVTYLPFAGPMAGKTTNGATFSAAVNGDAIFIFWGTNAGKMASISVLRFKPNGMWCWYLSTSSSQTPAQLPVNFSCIKRSGNSFVLFLYLAGGASGICNVTIPDYFVPNGVVYFSPTVLPIPVAPCSFSPNGLQEYFAENGHVLLEYVQGFPEAYNLAASTFLLSDSGIDIINAGMCGNFPNAQNPLVLFDNNIYGYPLNFGYTNGTFSYDSFGNLIYRDIEFQDKFGNFLGVYKAKLYDGTLNCQMTGGFPLYTVEEQYIYDSQNPVFNGFRFKAYYQSMNHGATDLPCSSHMTMGGSIQLYNGPTFVELANVLATYHQSGVYLKDANVWIGIENDGETVTVNTPRQPLPDAIKMPPPITNPPVTSSLLNWHRPVSTTGKFIT